ncbi:hypothetical protein [Pseudomonas sp. S2_C03]
MNARTFRYYLWAWPAVFVTSAFYSVMLVGGLKLFFGVDGVYLNVAGFGSYAVFCLLGLFYFVPRMKKDEFGESAHGQFTSVAASRVAIFVGGWIGTVLSAPVIDHVGLLSAMPRWLALSMLFAVFAIAVEIFSHYHWKPGQRR